MKKGLYKQIQRLLNFFHLKLHKIDHSNHEPIFLIRDYGQIKPYTLPLDKISDFKIIRQMRPTDSYIIGYATCFHNFEKLKYNSFSILENGKIIIKSTEVLCHNEISGELWELLSKEHVFLENCKGKVLRELITFSYRLGRDEGIKEYQKMLTLNQFFHDKKSAGEANIVEFNKYTNS